MRLLGLPASQGVQEALLGSRKGHRAAFTQAHGGRSRCGSGLFKGKCQLLWRCNSNAPSIPMAGTGGSMGSASDGWWWEEKGEVNEYCPTNQLGNWWPS